MSPREDDGRLGVALPVALLVAALVAGVLVYHARTPNLALEVPRLDRVLGTGPRGQLPVELEFFVRFDEPRATVEIAGREDATVRTFADGVALAHGERIECTWDGLDDHGDPVAPGPYRLRVLLPGQDREMVFPLRIRVGRIGDAERVALPGPECERVAAGEPFE